MADTGPVTIAQVAREAGVSRSTVSLVLQGSPRVARATQAHVRATIARLGYRPNPMAAGLRTRRSNLVGLMVSDLTFPHHAQIAMGAEDVLERAGRGLVVANSHGSLERERQLIETLRRAHVDGLLVTPLEESAEAFDHLRALRDEQYPLVGVYRELPGFQVDYCGVDVPAATEALVHYLAGTLGHRRIALLLGSPGTVGARWRTEGWRRALAAYGCDAPDELIVHAATDGAGGLAAIAALLERHVAFTAAVCSNDLMAQGVLRGLYRAGLLVPRDVSVAGMGDFGEYISPQQRLTTVGFAYRDIGRTAATLLLDRMSRLASTSGNAGQGSTAVQAEPELRLLPPLLQPGETTMALAP